MGYKHLFATIPHTKQQNSGFLGMLIHEHLSLKKKGTWVKVS